MDTTYTHLVLDRIREDQHHHMDLLQDIAKRQAEVLTILTAILQVLRSRRSAGARKKWSPPSVAIVTAIQYAMTLAVIMYMLVTGKLEGIAPLLSSLGAP